MSTRTPPNTPPTAPSDTTAEDSTGSGVDGRTLRRERNRTAILQAAAQLLSEGKPAHMPAAASAAGVSQRSAYRYFESQQQFEAILAAELAVPGLEVVETIQIRYSACTIDGTVTRLQAVETITLATEIHDDTT